MKRVTAVVAAAAAAAALAPSAVAAPGLLLGIADDGLKWRTPETVALARDLGVTAFRLTVPWRPGQTRIPDTEAVLLDRAVAAAIGMRIVVSVTGAATDAPAEPARRAEYCAFVRDLLARYPSIRDVVVWNEANLAYFWQPQYAGGRSIAPAVYGALLAECWDAVHDVRADANLVTTTSPRGNDNPRAATNVSHSPATFIRAMGAAYRASGRPRPIFDTVGHNVYGHSSERPWRQHPGSTHIAQGDIDALLAALREGFARTSQRIPGDCATGERCPAVWYLETGYQTRPSAGKAHLYGGRESDAYPVPDGAAGDEARGARNGDSHAPSHSTQLVDGIRLAFCQPHVGATFNFLLWDEPDLARWQSGLLWADGTRKESYTSFRRVVSEARSGAIDCAAVRRSQLTGSRSGRIVQRVLWERSRSFRRTHVRWRVRLAVRERADFRATLYRVAPRTDVFRARGSFRPGALRTVRFARRPLRRGVYRIEVVVTSADRGLVPVRLLSPRFRVR